MNALKFDELPEWQRNILGLVQVSGFEGHLRLWEQIISSSYQILDENGSLEIACKNSIAANLLNSVPFEFESIDVDDIKIHCIMHTSEGIIYYLQVFKEDDSNIIRFPSLNNTKLIINGQIPRL